MTKFGNKKAGRTLCLNETSQTEKYKYCTISHLSGGFNAAPWSAMDEEKDYQDMICLGRRGGQFSQRRRAQSLPSMGFY